MKLLLALVLLTVSGCAGVEYVAFEICEPRLMAEGRVSMNTPCIGWSNGYEVGRSPDSVAKPGFPVHKTLMIYHERKHIEAVVFEGRP